MGCNCRKGSDERARERAAKVTERRARIEAARAKTKEVARRSPQPRR